ncbi:8-oxo-dGTP pyrophosphatase MutT, NUDIX family [Thauera chlorobenzoica]|nr:8-oxo-dGTP pyrophosphatase MutT, NUDIX family [Thauera chlorobenzoica]
MPLISWSMKMQLPASNPPSVDIDALKARLSVAGRGGRHGDWPGIEQVGAHTPAAVLVPVVAHERDLSVLLTKRTAHLHHHPGQISFPGGRVEENDSSPVDTALRETEEEIGLYSRQVELLCALPDYFTGTGFRITPVVGLVHPPFELKLDAFEVAEAFEVPLSHFLDPANHQRHSMVHEGRLRYYHAMPYKGYYIWGATAGILMSLYRTLCGDAAMPVRDEG